ncbi:MAG: glycyl-radical enzyme activating protein [Firmicutes bacterium]|jgi:pyruvate formate lyase activating enzyme|nr:glycyl-radical enzyme activating protein [Bacillota bacterium]
MLGLVTNIQGYSVHDGPGIRTVVFMKGCPLECHWCSNPECISPHPELGFIKSLCTRCGKCAAACPHEAIIGKAGALPLTIREKCTGCGACAAVCISEARIIYGKQLAVDEVVDAVCRDQIFYQASGGGITVSGGEPLHQAPFVVELLRKCRQAAIHTCIETSGFASASALRQVLANTDYLLFDLKHLDSIKHRQYTGKSNRQILDNARLVAASGVDVLFRMPLIPGINDCRSNIEETAGLLHALGKGKIELMPYHLFGKGKYESLDRVYRLAGISTPGEEHLLPVKKMFEDFGIECSISN